jgi:hypothetical protein
MPKKVVLKTKKNDLSVSDYLNSIEPAHARRDAKLIAKLFKETTGASPKMWGSTIVGYGKYTYYRANGDEGEMMASGFSMRKSGPVLYIMPGYKNYSDILEKLGPHKLGKSCLYLKNLEGVDMSVLAGLIKSGLQDLAKSHSVVM